MCNTILNWQLFTSMWAVVTCVLLSRSLRAQWIRRRSLSRRSGSDDGVWWSWSANNGSTYTSKKLVINDTDCDEMCRRVCLYWGVHVNVVGINPRDDGEARLSPWGISRWAPAQAADTGWRCSLCSPPVMRTPVRQAPSRGEGPGVSVEWDWSCPAMEAD